MHPFSPAAASARSPLVPRPVRAMFLTLLLLAVALLAPSAAHAEAPRSVTVRDTTASVDRAALEAELLGVDFRTPVDLVVLALSSPHRGLVGEMAARKWANARVEDVPAALGETLAAAPALAWTVALEGIAAGAERVVVVSSGLDRQLGVVAFTREESR